MSLSKESGVPYTTIRSMIERNLVNASIDNVLKICSVLGIKAEELDGRKPTNAGNNLSESEILTLAAHKIGHEGALTEEQLAQIKLAMKIALAKNDK